MLMCGVKTQTMKGDEQREEEGTDERETLLLTSRGTSYKIGQIHSSHSGNALVILVM